MKLRISLAALLSLTVLHFNIVAQVISSKSVISTDKLSEYLKDDVLSELKTKDKSALAASLRQKFSERFFYDYQTFYDRLPHYNALYNNSNEHQIRAFDHIAKFADSTKWVLPFDYLNGEPVNAYALRHLARQHKMVDVAFHYFNNDKDPRFVKYFENQMRSLNAALQADRYEKIEDGNGVYEAFRAGYRVLNWLWIHNMFLNEAEYDEDDQLTTIATLLQHGQHLYENNAKFVSGNHQTRGVSALAMLAILLRDFEGTDVWLERAMLRLSEHLDKEINADGFQFERSVHYHMSDINNYFYVYQLAKLNGIEVEKAWKEKLKGLFATLIKISYPNRTAPVLQDDTDAPWAETNDISGAMTLGYLLFEEPEFGYFASDKVDERVYWFLSNRQIELLDNIKKKKPACGSLSFNDTGYYVMREGWNKDDMMMVISAGLDDEKPDHQHGDMLGIQAMANGHAILPNYQVRYSLEDFDVFKNSMVKNVALVDNELQGKQWTSNQGGSGFGKFRELPEPEVIAWEINDTFDFFVGSHNGFGNIGVDYTRQVIFVKDEFWMVKDNFQSIDTHDYKQVWQGHYTHENGPNLLRSVSSDATGHDILQLHRTDSVKIGGSRGKNWNVITKTNEKNFDFLTVIYPFKKYNNRLNELATELSVNNWKVNQPSIILKGTDAVSLSSDKGIFVFGTKELSEKIWSIQMPDKADLFIKNEENQLSIQSISSRHCTIIFTQKNTGKKTTRVLEPGQAFKITL